MSFGMPGTMEILLILLLLAIVFGARKLPELGRGLGEGIRNFRKSVKDTTDTSKSDDSDTDK
ncbi:MAG TPA: twin-arginine translocase TatA/TatE family subunit [bacterium]|nr:twin-arginine translocase TatA/TatE family subunit [bacterium]